MSVRRYILPVFFLVFLVASCGKVELPEEGDSADAPQSSVSADLPHVSVAEAQAAAGGTRVVVTGYVVGYINGTTLSAALFNVPADRENTNVLLADDAGETEIANVMPVQLDKNTAVRAALNLFASPENLHRRISVEGTLESYFGVQGLKNVRAYVWESSAPEPDPGGGNGGDDPPPDPDPGGDPDAPNHAPGMSDAPTYVPNGR